MSRSPTGARRALLLTALGQLLALSLWFSASAVAPQLGVEWGLDTGGEAWLTLAVQVGFVAGALISAVLNVADVVPARRLFFMSAIGGAIANLALLTVDRGETALAIGLRLLTGMFLAGVYPAGLKVMAGWFRSGRGMALGVLVGAVTVGSASPHLIRGLGFEWHGVLAAASGLAMLGAVVMLGVGDGPHEVPTPRFRWSQVAVVASNRGVRLSTLGYLGHMWELYGMWTWVGAYLAASAESAGTSFGSVAVITFLVIAIGGAGSWWAGIAADRLGRTRVAGTAMVISGSCALLTSVVFGAGPWLVVPLLLVWGLSVVADSAQFSAMVTETASDETRGTALTLQTALGFLLTLVTIRAVPAIAEGATWRWAFPILAVGPALGTWAMVRLARSPMASQLAGGRG